MYGTLMTPTSSSPSRPIKCKEYCATVSGMNLWQWVYKSGSSGPSAGCYCYDEGIQPKEALPSGASIIGGNTDAPTCFFDSYHIGIIQAHNQSLLRPLECQAWCENIDGANVYEWLTMSGFWGGCYCNYVNSTMTKESKTQNWGIGGSVVAPALAPALPADCLRNDYNYYGNDIKYVFTATVERCQKRCQETEGCVVFSWVTNWHCWLKSADKGGEYSSDVISGPRTCSSSST